MTAEEKVPVPPPAATVDFAATTSLAMMTRRRLSRNKSKPSRNPKNPATTRGPAAQVAQVDEIIRLNPDMLKHPDLVARAEQEALRRGSAPYSTAFHEDVRTFLRRI